MRALHIPRDVIMVIGRPCWLCLSRSAFSPALRRSSLGNGWAWWGNCFPTLISWMTSYWTVIFIGKGTPSKCMPQWVFTCKTCPCNLYPNQESKQSPPCTTPHPPPAPFWSLPLLSLRWPPSGSLTAQIRFSGFVLIQMKSHIHCLVSVHFFLSFVQDMDFCHCTELQLFHFCVCIALHCGLY